MPALEGEAVACEHGYHLLRSKDIIEWFGPALFEVEVERGAQIVWDANKGVTVGRCRLVRRVESWNERNLRLLACKFARKVLPIFEKARPNDRRPRECIEVAERFANGKATAEELAAAWAAAGAAARAAAEAAWNAAGDAKRKSQIKMIERMIAKG